VVWWPPSPSAAVSVCTVLIIQSTAAYSWLCQAPPSQHQHQRSSFCTVCTSTCIVTPIHQRVNNACSCRRGPGIRPTHYSHHHIPHGALPLPTAAARQQLAAAALVRPPGSQASARGEPGGCLAAGHLHPAAASLRGPACAVEPGAAAAAAVPCTAGQGATPAAAD
jgi:hypothetical protein